MYWLMKNKSIPYQIEFGYNQRVYPNTHCAGIGKSKGSQWVFSDATLCFTLLWTSYAIKFQINFLQ